MRLRTQPISLVGLLASSVLLLAGCGGSSSETPEPVRPDSWQLKLRHQRQLAAATENEPSRLLNRDDSFQPNAPPRSTWGSDSAKSRKPQKPPRSAAFADESDVTIAPPSSTKGELAPPPAKPSAKGTAPVPSE